MVKQTKFTYSLLGKAFKKQTKTIEMHGEKASSGFTNLKVS